MAYRVTVTLTKGRAKSQSTYKFATKAGANAFAKKQRSFPKPSNASRKTVTVRKV